jgi:nucleotide-binding universal stress UspA family protein
MFKKILVPLDGSQIAARILPKVTDLAKSLKAEVTLMHVCYAGVGAEIGETSPAVIKQAAAEEVKFCEIFLGQAGKDLKDKGIKADWVCRDGDPAREIISYAQNQGYDLIALGTHGSGETVWYMGGIANKVATHATVPVLLFRTLEVKPPMLKEIYFTA